MELASSLQEVQNVVDTTFGGGATLIYNWAESADESFGISELAAQQYTGTLGAMLKSMGLTSAQVQQMSTDMTGLAGDLASFHNLDVADAFEKIRSGISGETEPLKQLGINMSVANLEAYALAQGIETAYSKMSQAEQATLRYNYLMSVTADAQGDFANTSEGFANQERILEMNIQTLSATMGEQLLPVLNEAIIMFNEKLPEAEEYIEKIGVAFAAAAEFVIDNGEAIITVIGAIGAYKVATTAATAAQAAFNVVMSANPYVLVAGGVVAAVGAVLHFSDAQKKAVKEAEEAKKAYDEQAEIVDGLNEQLETNKARVEELLQLKFPSYADRQEIAELQAVNRELEIQIELEKERLRLAGMEAEKEAVEAIEQTYADARLELQQYNDALSALEDSYEAGDISYEYYQAQLEELDKFKVQLLDYQAEMHELAESVQGFTESGNEALKTVSDFENELYNLFELGDSKPAASVTWYGGDIAAEQKRKFEEGQAAYSAALQAGKAKIAQEQQAYIEETTLKLAEEWENAEHNYAVGIISSEEALYAEKKRIWAEYGDESLKDHWSYYEDIKQYDKNYAEEQAKIAKEAAEEKAKIEEEERKKAEKEAEEALKKQEEIVKNGLSEILKDYEEAYEEMKKKREDYRDKLMSVGGDLFSVDISKDKDGNEVKTYTVNNLEEQLKAMREYHSAVKRLKEQKASDALLSELTSMDDEDSAQMAKYLAGMSAKEFAKINTLYNEKQALADSLSQDLYADEAQKISDSMTMALAELSVSAYSYGAHTAEQFSAGFEDTMKELGVTTLFNQVQAAGAAQNYDNIKTGSIEKKTDFAFNIDISGKSTVYLDKKAVGEVITDYQAEEIKARGD